MAKPTIISGDWLDSDVTARELSVSIRTVQKYAQRGYLEFKTVSEDNRRIRLYSAIDVQKIKSNGGPPKAPAFQRHDESKAEITVVKKPTRPQVQESRALDTISLVGNLVIGHKAEMEMLVSQMGRNLETVVNMILTAQKAEADANRERLKAEREDARERWEIERRDRLERRKTKPVLPEIAKAASAR